MKRIKKELGKIAKFLLLCACGAALALLAVISGSSCSSSTLKNSKSTSDPKLALLEAELAALKSDQSLRDAEYLAKIGELEAKISAPPPVESGKKPAESATGTLGEPSSPEDVRNGFIYEVLDGEVTITAYVGNDVVVVIPSSIGGAPVTVIGDGAFEGTNVKDVTLPSTLKSIGWFAFCGCLRLEVVRIPSSVTEIGYEAFSRCRYLTVVAAEGSYAETYARSYGIDVSRR